MNVIEGDSKKTVWYSPFYHELYIVAGTMFEYDDAKYFNVTSKPRKTKTQGLKGIRYGSGIKNTLVYLGDF